MLLPQSFLSVLHQDNDGEDEERLWRDLIMERVTKSADACLTALNVMTSLHMPKAVYIEDVIERVLQYTKFHLQNTLYPQYDPVYRIDPKGGEKLHFCLFTPCQTNSIKITHFMHFIKFYFGIYYQFTSVVVNHQFIKCELCVMNELLPNIFMWFEPCVVSGSMLSSKAKRAKCSTAKQRVIVMLYNKVCDVVSNISELLEIQLMTDTTILQVGIEQCSVFVYTL